MKVIGTGLTGLVGSRIVELLPDYQFENISRSTGVDITNKEQVFNAIKNSPSQIILHLAAYTNVDEAEKEKDLPEQSQAWKINVEGTRNIIEVCQTFNKKIIYFSTDMVFPGNKELSGKYSEEEETGAVGFYAKTKEEAEKLVEKADCPWAILRIAYPYRANFEKKEYVRIFKNLLEQGKSIKAVEDHYFTPTFIDDLAPVLDLIIANNLIGKFHVVGEEIVSPYIAAAKVAEIFGLDKNLVEKTTREEFFKEKAPRAYNLALSNDKILKLGIRLRAFSEGLEEIKKQLEL